MHRLTKIINRRMTILEVFELTDGKYREDYLLSVGMAMAKRGAKPNAEGKYRVKDIMCGIAANMPAILQPDEVQPAAMSVGQASKNPCIAAFVQTHTRKNRG